MHSTLSFIVVLLHIASASDKEVPREVSGIDPQFFKFLMELYRTKLAYPAEIAAILKSQEAQAAQKSQKAQAATKPPVFVTTDLGDSSLPRFQDIINGSQITFANFSADLTTCRVFNNGYTVTGARCESFGSVANQLSKKASFVTVNVPLAILGGDQHCSTHNKPCLENGCCGGHWVTMDFSGNRGCNNNACSGGNCCVASCRTCPCKPVAARRAARNTNSIFEAYKGEGEVQMPLVIAFHNGREIAHLTPSNFLQQANELIRVTPGQSGYHQ